MKPIYKYTKELRELKKLKSLARHGQRVEAYTVIDAVFQAVKEREILYPIKVVQLTNPELMHVDVYGNIAMKYKYTALADLQDIRREFSQDKINIKVVTQLVNMLDSTKFYSIPTLEKLESFQTVNTNRPIKIECIRIRRTK